MPGKATSIAKMIITGKLILPYLFLDESFSIFLSFRHVSSLKEPKKEEIDTLI